MRLVKIAFLFMLLVAPVSAFAADWTSDFIKQVAAANQFEIQESQLAVQQASNDKVRQFAQTMVDEYTAAGDALSEVAGKAGYSSSLGGVTQDYTRQKQLETLAELSGADFDRRYISDQVDAHEEIISLFDKYVLSNIRGLVREFAIKTQPALHERQTAALALRQ